MTRLPLRYHHWTYVWFPIVGAVVWFGTLLAMLVVWLASGRPHYVSQEGNIAYISDVGAGFLKPLFIAGSSVTAVCFFLTLFAERWLRHSGRLMPNMRQRERICGSLAVLGAFIGGLGVILLSIFDTARHMKLHRVFLLIFMVGVAMSAIFTIVEYRWISKDFVSVRTLKKAYIAKIVIAGILIILAIAFAACLFSAKATSKSNEAGAILEWGIAFGFTIYLLTFYVDLRQSKNVERGALTGYKHGQGFGQEYKPRPEGQTSDDRMSRGSNANTATGLV